MIEVKPWEPMIRCVDDSGREYWFVSFSEFIKHTHRSFGSVYYWENRLAVRAFTELGEEISQWKIREGIADYRKSLRAKRGRGDAPRSKGTKPTSYRYHRKISTMSERRQNVGVVHDEGQVMVRGRRRHLPSSWDDFCRCVQHSWKAHRKTQWK